MCVEKFVPENGYNTEYLALIRLIFQKHFVFWYNLLVESKQIRHALPCWRITTLLANHGGLMLPDSCCRG